MEVALSGNEAIARGAFESGVLFAAGYPGTPGTEILEEIAKFADIHAQWSPNEKVAIDTALGASLGGMRSLVAMKHVGLNVASDTLMTVSYTGVNAGLVVVTADDPGMHSSQNEQDNRNYAKFAKIPLLEPSDSQEAKDSVRLALRISEMFDTPVLIKVTARIAHSRSVVEISRKRNALSPKRSYTRNAAKYVMIPANAKKRRLFVEKRLARLKNFTENVPCNKIEWGKKNIGIVTSGISYQYAKEACPDASFLKLGMTYPLPEYLIRRFAGNFPFLYIVEESDPFLEEQIRAMGIRVKGKELFPSVGELNPDLVKNGLLNKNSKSAISDYKRVPARLPLLCAGCSYLGLFYVLKKLNVTAIGDIGCYALGALHPISSIDTCISMGSSIGIASGLKKALKGASKKKIVAVIGDSTFIHSGITPLIDVVYNKCSGTIIILDNKTTAMTGGQNHPGTGVTLKEEKTAKIDYTRLAKGLGIKRVRTIDCYNLSETEKILKEAIADSRPSVIIAKNPCLLISKRKRTVPLHILPALCVSCRACLKLGCSAILTKGGRPYIDTVLCTGCFLCRRICPAGAIKVKRVEKQ
ncbi:MAG: indolepyruvate ferredoxin oxidoreductase subunit alpha [Omnitrophica bacterium RBG_13_46_9]|nr:MAG: indolepyruvate ferredoxin oxidoreductase subunit alpha [Omnitrophica bacterium RBG_13_46_9]